MVIGPCISNNSNNEKRKEKLQVYDLNYASTVPENLHVPLPPMLTKNSYYQFFSINAEAHYCAYQQGIFKHMKPFYHNCS